MQAAMSKGPDTDQTSARRQPERSWSVVLAGGEDSESGGADYIQLGARRPSQYHASDDETTLLEQSLESAVAVSGRNRLVTLIGHGHAEHLDDRRIRLPGTIIEQPRRRGTAAATLLCILHHGPRSQRDRDRVSV